MKNSTFSFAMLRTPLLLILFMTIASPWASAQSCGDIVKSKSTAYFDSLSIDRPDRIFDRFGNEYLASELSLKKLNPSTILTNQPSAYSYDTTWTMDVGMFRLYFAKDKAGYGFDDVTYRQLVAQVYRDIDRLLFDVMPTNPARVNIWVASDSMYIQTQNGNYPTSAGAFASSFYILPNGSSHLFFNNEVSKTIRLGFNSYTTYPTFTSNEFVHGILVVGFSSSLLDSHYRSTTISSSQYDMYTAILHEVYHQLGMSSALLPNGQSNTGFPFVYHTYDKYLCFGNDSSKRILNIDTTTGVIQYNNVVSNLSTGCNTTNSPRFYGRNLKYQSIYAPVNYTAVSSFSHLSCEAGSGCTNYAAPSNTYVTAYCLNPGSSYIKRRPNASEVKLLCDLGYRLRVVNGVLAYGVDATNSTVYQTYSTSICDSSLAQCDPLGVNDGVYSVNIGDSLVILKSTIMQNDISTSQIANVKLLDSRNGTLRIYSDRIVYYPSSRTEGTTVVISYVPTCNNGKNFGNTTHIRIIINVNTLPICPPSSDCNMICEGDFEGYHNIRRFNYVYYVNYYNISAVYNGTTDMYYRNCWDTTQICKIGNSGIPCQINDTFCTTLPSTVNVIPPNGGRHAVGTGHAFVNGVYGTEQLNFFLKKPMEAGKTYQFKMQCRRRDKGGFQSVPHKMLVLGDSVIPCLTTMTKIDGSVSSCGYRGVRLDRKTLKVKTTDTNWMVLTDTFTPTKKITNLFILNDTFERLNGISIDAYCYMYFDNFELREIGTTPLRITSEALPLRPCISDSVYRIRYTICADSVDMASDVTLKLTLPAAVIRQNASSFNASYLYTIPKDSLKKGMCRFAYLYYKLNTATTLPDVSLDIKLETTNATLCYQTNDQSVVSVTPIVNPLTWSITADKSMVKTGDTMLYTVTLCNSGKNALSNILLSSLLPSTLMIIDTIDFHRQGQMLTRSVTSSGTINPVYPSCQTFRFRAKVIRNCQLTVCASYQSPTTSCIMGTSCVTVQSDPTDTSSLVLDGYIQSRVNCLTGKAILKAVPIFDQSGFEYLWAHDPITQEIEVNNLTQKYTVTITHTATGCKTVISERPNPDSFIKLGSGYGSTGYMGIGTAFASGRIPSKDMRKLNLRIKGIFAIDHNVDIRYCDFLLEQGAQIELISQCDTTYFKKVRLQSNNFYTCDTFLAHGLLVHGCTDFSNLNYKLDFVSNEVRDCYKGMEIRRSMTPLIANNLFENNVIGLHIYGEEPMPSFYKYSDIYLPNGMNIYGNTWRGTSMIPSQGTVKRVYSGMMNEPYTYVPFTPALFNTPLSSKECYAGIIAEYTTHIHVGNLGYAPNVFQNLTNGILMIGSYSQIVNSRFENMIAPLQLSPSITSTAVYAERSLWHLPSGKLQFQGLGKTNATTTIWNAKYGIVSNEMFQMDISQTRMEGIGAFGIQHVTESTPGTSKYFTANANNIGSISGSQAKGIELIDNSVDNLKATIQNNNVTANTSYYGIKVSKNTLMAQSSTIDIQNNTVNGSMVEGILVENYPKPQLSPYLRVMNNSCYLTSATMHRYGFHYINNQGMLDKENAVSGVSASLMSPYSPRGLYPIGMAYEKTTGTLTCNAVNNIYTGVRFLDNCNLSQWTKNKIGNHNLGLRIDTLTTLQNQTRAGNTFKGSCIIEAKTLQSFPQTLFYYSNSNTDYVPSPRFPTFPAWWLPVTTIGSPETDNCSSFISAPSGYTGIAIGFKGDIIFRSASTSKFYPMMRNNVMESNLELTTVDTAILTNTMTFRSFETELLWQYRQELFNKLLPYREDFRDTSIFRDYLTAIEEGSINEFTEINKIQAEMIETLEEPTSVIQTKEQEIDSLYRVWAMVDSLIALGDADTMISPHDSTRVRLIQAIQARQSELHAMVMNAKNVYLNELPNIIALNDTIVLEGVADSLKQVFNAVYYQTYGALHPQLTKEQQDVFYALSYRCPFENSDVVYRSRAIVRSYLDSVEYNDSVLCAQIGVTLKSAARPLAYHNPNESPVIFSIFPNPTNGMTKLISNKILDKNVHILITDILGREVYNKFVFLDTNVYGIETKNWNEGLYLIQVFNTNTLLFKTQLQVTK